MATADNSKRRAMDAITHPETQTHMRLFRGGSLAKGHTPNPHKAEPEPRMLTPQAIKRFAMNTISNVETVAQVGTMRLVGGIALYSARIMEVDREAQRDAALRKLNKAQEKESHELGRE
jgi:hypothetical protein